MTANTSTLAATLLTAALAAATAVSPPPAAAISAAAAQGTAASSSSAMASPAARPAAPMTPPATAQTATTQTTTTTTATTAPATAAPARTAPAGPLPSAKELLDRFLAARGGKAKLDAIQTRRESGRLSLAPGAEWPFTIEHKRPRSFRMEIELQGAKLIRAYDGVHGWQQQPQKKAAEEMSDDDRRNVAGEADFDFFGPLVDTFVKGHPEVLGRAAADGHDVIQLKVVVLSGDVLTYDLDAATYLPTHVQGARWINGKPSVFETSFADYRDVDGIKYPFVVTLWVKGSTQKQTRTLQKIENNPPIDDARFAVPAGATPPPTAAAPATAPPSPPKPTGSGVR